MEPGCLTFSATQDEENSCRFNVYEEFVNQAAFDAHQARVKASKWSEVTQNAVRNYTVSLDA